MRAGDGETVNVPLPEVLAVLTGAAVAEMQNTNAAAARRSMSITPTQTTRALQMQALEGRLAQRSCRAQPPQFLRLALVSVCHVCVCVCPPPCFNRQRRVESKSYPIPIHSRGIHTQLCYVQWQVGAGVLMIKHHHHTRRLTELASAPQTRSTPLHQARTCSRNTRACHRTCRHSRRPATQTTAARLTTLALSMPPRQTHRRCASLNCSPPSRATLDTSHPHSRASPPEDAHVSWLQHSARPTLMSRNSVYPGALVSSHTHVVAPAEKDDAYAPQLRHMDAPADAA